MNRGDLWAVTSYFNPCRYRRRLSNYRAFRERLRVPLLTVELSHDGTFELDDTDADRLVRRECADVLWQKERLLNLGIDNLPASCEVVAWLDGDVVFAREDWMVETAARLRSDAAILQLFRTFTDLRAEAFPEDAGPADLPRGESFASVASFEERRREVFEVAEPSLQRVVLDGVPTMQRSRSSGFAWAARRDLLQRHGLYDACILGGGDRAIACAAYGRAASSVQMWMVNEAQRRHYRHWGEAFGRAVDGRCGFVDGHLFHLWHGDLGDRRYYERWRVPEVSTFDPESDLRIDDRGVWRWGSEKPGLHRVVREYFGLRREDGNAATSPA